MWGVAIDTDLAVIVAGTVHLHALPVQHGGLGHVVAGVGDAVLVGELCGPVTAAYRNGMDEQRGEQSARAGDNPFAFMFQHAESF